MDTIVLVDGVTKSSLEENPKIKERINFPIQQHKDCRKELFVKPARSNDKNKLIPISEYQKKEIGIEVLEMLVPSELYHNVYFNAKDYSEQYWDEFKRILEEFSVKIGGDSEVKFFRNEEEYSKYRKDVGCKSETNVNVKPMGANGQDQFMSNLEADSKMAYQSNQEKTIYNRSAKKSFLKSSQPKCSQEEIKKWIEEERINIDSLPVQLKVAIKDFLDKGYLDIEFHEREKISKEIHSVVKKSLEIGGSIKAMAPKVVLSLAGKLGGVF